MMPRDRLAHQLYIFGLPKLEVRAKHGDFETPQGWLELRGLLQEELTRRVKEEGLRSTILTFLLRKFIRERFRENGNPSKSAS